MDCKPSGFTPVRRESEGGHMAVDVLNPPNASAGLLK